MLAKAFDVPRYFPWSPLTLLIRSFLIEHFSSCPNCCSENVVRDGYGERKSMPDIPMLECNDCGRDFCLRADTIFYWKHASEGELFLISWIFFGIGSRGWMHEWINKLGEFCCSEWFRRMEKKLVEYAGGASEFLDGFFQADEMHIRSFGEKLLVFGVKRSDSQGVYTLPGRWLLCLIILWHHRAWANEFDIEELDPHDNGFTAQDISMWFPDHDTGYRNIHDILGRCEEQGTVGSGKENGRKYYWLTPKGKSYVEWVIDEHPWGDEHPAKIKGLEDYEYEIEKEIREAKEHNKSPKRREKWVST